MIGQTKFAKLFDKATLKAYGWLFVPQEEHQVSKLSYIQFYAGVSCSKVK